MIFLVMFFAACFDIKPLEIGHIHSVRVKKITQNGMNFGIVLPIKNPNHFDFKVKKVDIELKIDDIVVGKVRDIDKVKIVADTTQLYCFQMNVKLEDIIDGGLRLFKSVLAQNVNASIDGYIKVKAYCFVRKIRIKDIQKVLIIKY